MLLILVLAPLFCPSLAEEELRGVKHVNDWLILYIALHLFLTPLSPKWNCKVQRGAYDFLSVVGADDLYSFSIHKGLGDEEIDSRTGHVVVQQIAEKQGR